MSREASNTAPMQTVSMELLVKIGSALVHAEEALSPNGHDFDIAAFYAVLDDSLVRQWLKEMGDAALLPSEAANTTRRRFAVGQKVRVIAENWRGPRVGKVIHIWSDGNGGRPYQVAFRKGVAWNLAESELEARE